MAKRLTAKQLGITSEERKALIKVRDGLARGDFEHRAFPDPDNKATKPLFNMLETYEKWECGTVGCIGGWMNVAMGKRSRRDYLNFSGELDCLFSPVGVGQPWFSLTTEQAVKAIDNFLETGTDRPWARRKRAA